MANSNKNSVQPWSDHIFESLFKLFYIFQVLPYEIVKDNKGEPQLKSNTWRKYFCGLSTIIAAGFVMIFVSIPMSQATIRSPSILFHAAPELGDAILCGIFWYVIWTRKKQITKLISATFIKNCSKWRLSKHPLSPDKVDVNVPIQMKQIKRHFSIVIAGIVFAYANYFCYFIKLIGTLYNALEMESLPQDSLFGYILEQVREVLNLGKRSPRRFHELAYFEIAEVVIFLFFSLAAKLATAFAMLLALAGSFTFFKSVMDFNEFLRRETDEVKMMLALQAFRENVEMINGVIGPILFCIAIICAPTFFVANIAAFITTWGVASYNILLIFLAYSLIMNVAGEAAYATSEIKEWILNRYASEYEDELFEIYIELSQNPIGLQGLECVTITNGFLGKVLGAVINFAIILLQFSQGAANDPFIPKS